jgi:hypothetical protein
MGIMIEDEGDISSLESVEGVAGRVARRRGAVRRRRRTTRMQGPGEGRKGRENNTGKCRGQWHLHIPVRPCSIL